MQASALSVLYFFCEYKDLLILFVRNFLVTDDLMIEGLK